MRKSKRYTEGARRVTDRDCDWPRCVLPGEYRAPRDRSAATNYWWFCLEHVRRYNAEWDYFRGMSVDEIDGFRDEAETWHRPTWPLGQRPAATAEWVDPYGVASAGASFRSAPAPGPLIRPLRRKDVRALRTLGLDENSTAAAVRKQYKRLVKLYHPDTNAGDNSASKRLQAVVEAYNHLARYLPRAG